MLTVMVQGDVAATALHFKAEASAKLAYANVLPAPAESQFEAPAFVQIEDDFGRWLCFPKHMLAKALLERLDTAVDGDTGAKLIAHRAAAGLQIRLLDDPDVQRAQRKTWQAQQGAVVPRLG